MIGAAWSMESRERKTQAVYDMDILGSKPAHGLLALPVRVAQDFLRRYPVPDALFELLGLREAAISL